MGCELDFKDFVIDSRQLIWVLECFLEKQPDSEFNPVADPDFKSRLIKFLAWTYTNGMPGPDKEPMWENPWDEAFNRLHQIESVLKWVRSFLEKRRALAELPYEEYLASDYWKALRGDFFPTHCRLCDNPAEHLHHRHYRNRGFETEEDLTPLCGDCHAKFHNKPFRGKE